MKYKFGILVSISLLKDDKCRYLINFFVIKIKKPYQRTNGVLRFVSTATALHITKVKAKSIYFIKIKVGEIRIEDNLIS